MINRLNEGDKMRINKKLKAKLTSIMPGVYGFMKERYQYHMYKVRSAVKPEDYPKQLKKQYRKMFGIDLDMEHPKMYSEKIQWLKLYDDNPSRTELSDKVAVREWIKKTIGEEYLMPIIGIYQSSEEIDWDSLPQSFVIKLNHGSGWNIIVKDKKKLNIKKTKTQIDKWMKLDYAFWNAFEIHYSPIRPQIIIEKYVEDSHGLLNDYKFLCFDGEVKYFWVDFDRTTNHKRNVYDENWVLQPWNQRDYGNYEGVVDRPENFSKMWEIAHILCQGFRHVRVDLYNVDGRIYFGEMTFTNGSGYEGIFPTQYEYVIGDLIPLPTDDTK